MALTVENSPALVRHLGLGNSDNNKEGKANMNLQKFVLAQVLRQTSFSGEAARVGSVVRLEENEFKRLKANGKVTEAEPGAKLHLVTKEEAAALVKANAADGQVQNRDPRARTKRDAAE